MFEDRNPLISAVLCVVTLWVAYSYSSPSGWTSQ